MADASVARAPRRISVKWVWWVLAMALIASPFSFLIFNPLKSTAPSTEIELTLPPRPAESEYRKTPSPREQEHAALPTPETPTATRPVPSKPNLAETRPAGRAETGRASWYTLKNATASGEAVDDVDLTAAHPSLPLGTKVLVENLDNGRFVVVRINDRGPFTHNRIIDLSKAAAEKLGMVAQGVANVRVSRLEGDVANLPSPR